MDSDTLKQLIHNKTLIDLQTTNQDFEKRLQLVVQDIETGEMGLLTVEPTMLANFDREDDAVLWYEYREITDRLAPSPEHFYNIATRVGPDYDTSDVPFPRGEQGGLFQ